MGHEAPSWDRNRSFRVFNPDHRRAVLLPEPYVPSRYQSAERPTWTLCERIDLAV
jgi:hypothetical protein